MCICQNYHHQSSSIFCSQRFALRLGNSNKTSHFPKQWARQDMNFTYWYSHFLHRHADQSQTNSPSPWRLRNYTTHPSNFASRKYIHKHSHTNMSNFHAHMPMRAHAYKNHNELEQIMPQESAQKIYENTHQYQSFYTRFPLVHVGLRKLGKADVKHTTTLLTCLK